MRKLTSQDYKFMHCPALAIQPAEASAPTPQAVSNNLAWLKLIAMIAMLFDHAAIGILRALHQPVFTSFWRLPGRLSIPLYASLIAYSYTYYTRNKRQFMVRLWAFAAITEPIYRLYFLEAGNVLIPLALGVTFLYWLEQLKTPFSYGIPIVVASAIIEILTLITGSVLMFTIPVLIWLFSKFVTQQNHFWLIPIAIAALLSNHLGWPEAVMFVCTLSLVLFSMRRPLPLPQVQINKWFGYGFYPGHLLVLYGLFFVCNK